MRLQALQFSALALLSVVSAFDIRGAIYFDFLLANKTISAISKVSLDYGARSAFIRKDGTFEIPNVPDGQHVLEPVVPGYTFTALLLTISSPEIHIQSHHPARQPLSTSTSSLAYPLQLRATAREDYFTLPAGMNILGLLKSPMVLMMGFSGIMMLALPKLMASMDMDPDMAKDVAETRKRMQDMQNMDFMGSISNMLAGSEDVDPAPAASSTTGTGTPSKAGGGGNGGGGATNGAGKRRKGR